MSFIKKSFIVLAAVAFLVGGFFVAIPQVFASGTTTTVMLTPAVCSALVHDNWNPVGSPICSSTDNNWCNQADRNNDGVVGSADLAMCGIMTSSDNTNIDVTMTPSVCSAIVHDNWNPAGSLVCSTDNNSCNQADRNNDGVVDAADLAMCGMMANQATVSAPDLGTAANFAVLAKTAVTTTGVTAITGNVGISPAAASDTTGFGLVLDSTGCFSSADPLSLVTGKIYAADYSTNGCTTPAVLTTAVSDMQTAYTDAAGRAPTSAATTNVGSGTLTDLTLTSGVYEWGTALNIPTDLTLSGSATDIWIFKVAGTLDMASDKNVILSGGALPQNIFWQVSGAVTLGTGSHFEGNILAQTNIAMQTGATLNGRALAQTAVTLDSNTIVASTGDIIIPVVLVTPLTPAVTNTEVVPTQVLGGGGGSGGCAYGYNFQTGVCNLAPVVTGLVLGASTSTVSTTGLVLGASTFRFTNYLRQGVSSSDVTQLQERFRGEGYFTFHTSTGYFGPITLAAVKAYQRTHGISATGFVGVLTTAELNK